MALSGIDLRPDLAEIVKQILAEHVPECEVRAFGSRAAWTARDYSDLDLIIMGDGPIDWQTMGRLKEDFEESRLPMRVDVLDWHSIPDRFKEGIKHDYVVVSEGRDSSAWHRITLGEFSPLRYGKSLPARKRDPAGEIPVYGSNGVIGTHTESLTDGPTVIVGRKGSVGVVHYSPVPCWPIDTTFYLAGEESDLVRFQYFLLSALGLEKMNSDSAVPGLNRLAAHERELTVPPEAEQRRIARVLGVLDDKIELNRRMCQTLEEMSQALFKSWFVDFDPVRAKMEARWRPGESLPGLPAHLYDLFPDRLVDSELGPIPEGWRITTLGSLCSKPQYGYTQSGETDPVGPKFLRITDINKHLWIDWDQVPYCRISDTDFRKYRLSPGDVLIARMADPGHGCVIDTIPPSVFASYLIRFRPLNSDYSSFFRHWMRSDQYWSLVRARATGTTRKSLNARVLSGFSIIDPTEPVIAAFHRYVDIPRYKVSSLINASRILRGYRETLLPKLLSGELQVPMTSESTTS